MEYQNLIKVLAAMVLKELEQFQRVDGTAIWRMADTASRLTEDLVFHVHDGMQADDFKHQFLVRSLKGIVQHQGDLTDLELYVDGEPLTNNSTYITWFISDKWRSEYFARINFECSCDEEEAEMTLADQLWRAMTLELKHTLKLTLEFLSRVAKECSSFLTA